MMKHAFLLICAGFMLAVALPVKADPGKADPVEAEPAEAETGTELSEEELRLSLAKKMHEIRPTRMQVEMALARVSMENIPPAERENFRQRVIDAMDIQRLERISIEAMADVFTLPELERMVAYYLTPEARSITMKMPLFQGIIQPEIVRMLDNAILEMRTGRSGDRDNP